MKKEGIGTTDTMWGGKEKKRKITREDVHNQDRRLVEVISTASVYDKQQKARKRTQTVAVLMAYQIENIQKALTKNRRHMMCHDTRLDMMLK